MGGTDGRQGQGEAEGWLSSQPRGGRGARAGQPTLWASVGAAHWTRFLQRLARLISISFAWPFILSQPPSPPAAPSCPTERDRSWVPLPAAPTLSPPEERTMGWEEAEEGAGWGLLCVRGPECVERVELVPGERHEASQECRQPRGRSCTAAACPVSSCHSHLRWQSQSTHWNGRARHQEEGRRATGRSGTGWATHTTRCTRTWAAANPAASPLASV